MAVKVYDLQLDDGNATEMVRHGVTEREVRQVLDGRPVFARNKKHHAATILMIGPTNGGRLLTVPLAPTKTDGLWRPATAFESSAREIAVYQATRPR